MDYMEQLKIQENEPIIGTKGLIFTNKPPEDNPSDSIDIGYGHKLTKAEVASGLIYGIPYKEGITEEDAVNILKIDVIAARTRAKRVMGDEVWEGLPEAGKELLGDFVYTGVLEKFPSLRVAVERRDKAGALREYERKFTKDDQLVPMDRRNELGLALLNDMDGYWL